MVVHLGVVVIAVALAAATSFGHRGEVTLRPGQSALSDGHRITYVGLTNVRTAASTATEALVRVDGHGLLRPALTQFGAGTQAVGTPAIDSGPVDDVYLTVDDLPVSPGGAVTIGVTVQPLVAWLWAGGGLVVLGSLLAAVPGRRRRATDPVSAPVPAVVARAGAAPDPPRENEDGVLDGVAAAADAPGAHADPGDGVSGGRDAPEEPDRPRPVPVATP
jgi:cytochrome c-type biogenesis protein CcmF